jgi:HK97 family phage portal protein
MFHRLRNAFGKIRLKSYEPQEDETPPTKPEAYSDVETFDINLSTDITKNWDTYEKLYLEYTDTQAHLDIITALVVGNGFRFVGDEQGVKLCEEFAKQVNLHQVLENCVLTCLIFGNSYAVIVRDDDCLPTVENNFGISLFVPHPRKMRIIVNKYGEIDYYWYDPNANFVGEPEYKLDPRFVMHFKLKNYADKPYGLSLLHSAYSMLKIKKLIEQMSAVMAFRSSHGLLWAKVELTDRDYMVNPETGKTFAEEKIEEVARTLSNRVKESGDTITITNNFVFDQTVELKNLAVQNDFTSVSKVLEHLQNQVDRALKVPKVFLGEPEGSNRATSYNQLLVFKLFIESIQRKFESEINRKLIPLIASGVEFKFNPPLKEDISELVDQATKLYQYGIITEEEARKWINLPPKPSEEEEE